ncbi:MAG: peptide/nickel transport system substrate-binding protein, partial [Thermomicrobiales bacterium]|nr:peptide/nickel transport system substrate-binding protein [Thermomicrobiales bacterium]
ASGNQEGKETAVYVQQALGFFFFFNWISINNAPFYHLFWLFRSDCCNYTNDDNQAVWQAIDANVLNTDAAAREQAASDIQQTIVDEAPWVFLYQPDFLLAMRSTVKGYTYYSADRFTRYKFLYKE